MEKAGGKAAIHRASTPMHHVPPPRRRGRPNTDTVKLLMLGYKQELEREFTLFNSFGSGFTLLSSLTSLSGTYGIGITYGGPVVMIWGWLVVTLFATSVGLSMAELASAYPTSGALYYWSYKLAPPRLRNLACWMTAWILTLGQAALSASAFYTFVHLLATAVEVQYGVNLSQAQVFGILVGVSVTTGLLNCGTARLTAFMVTLGTMWHIVALIAFCVCVLVVAPARQPAKYMFTSWQAQPEVTGISGPVYTTLVGLLMSQSCYIGYDGAAHLAEETFHAETNVPRAILHTCVGMGVAGFAFLLTMISVKLDVATLLDPGNETHGTNVVLQILIEIAKSYGYKNSGVALFSIPIVAAFFCSYQSIANNSRMLYAFARDDGVPLANYAKRVHPRTKAPVYAVLYMVLLSGLLATPMCFNAYVFPAILSFAVAGCYLAYALPVICKLSTGRRFFLPGPFFLGPRLSYINNIVSSVWVLAMTVTFCLPQFYPVTLINLNWSAPILGVALVSFLGWYYLPRYGARHWFIGPRANLGQFKDELPSERARKAVEKEAAEAAAAVAADKSARAASQAAALFNRVANGTCGGSIPTVNSLERSAHAGGSTLGGGTAAATTGARRSSIKSLILSSSGGVGGGLTRGRSVKSFTAGYGGGGPSISRILAAPAAASAANRPSQEPLMVLLSGLQIEQHAGGLHGEGLEPPELGRPETLEGYAPEEDGGDVGGSGSSSPLGCYSPVKAAIAAAAAAAADHAAAAAAAAAAQQQQVFAFPAAGSGNSGSGGCGATAHLKQPGCMGSSNNRAATARRHSAIDLLSSSDISGFMAPGRAYITPRRPSKETLLASKGKATRDEVAAGGLGTGARGSGRDGSSIGAPGHPVSSTATATSASGGYPHPHHHPPGGERHSWGSREVLHAAAPRAPLLLPVTRKSVEAAAAAAARQQQQQQQPRQLARPSRQLLLQQQQLHPSLLLTRMVSRVTEVSEGGFGGDVCHMQGSVTTASSAAHSSVGGGGGSCGAGGSGVNLSSRARLRWASVSVMVTPAAGAGGGGGVAAWAAAAGSGAAAAAAAPAVVLASLPNVAVTTAAIVMGRDGVEDEGGGGDGVTGAAHASAASTVSAAAAAAVNEGSRFPYANEASPYNVSNRNFAG
ncbi:hypothetical protein Agub_g13583 [Astrephomene gubernaculifera]|uniref:Uncharacterized protein n=1 Tax=Astrephomene gubernaculifera TaxID=47775 RepID=A0AAD3HSS7_9CHLO|nr:hypothetical protein Agub_g13583 [Astrephomene gubernaculifera]